ncbi:fad-binding domain containing protein [Ophiostoma piceae UAMH 11346]|uniref:Fad-binding domain containing protein n=1 Tax=Ophiostoma piceae (strain UAMH 11346) TaxID=1262450 RepID=S3CB69_OPHP1|nr:fad-binding domain containing protein [Ophiostoma piceae UAMH 11346]
MSLPVLIIGGGIVGLTLAQGLKKAGIPFQVYERDADADVKSGGWGITVHWALPALAACLPDDLYARLTHIQVDPQQGIRDTGRFLFLDLATATPVYVIPPSQRLRINRRKLRTLLSEGIDVAWNKALVSVETPAADGQDGVVAHFADGSSAAGSLIVGADGSRSRTRRQLFPDNAAAAQLYSLPVRFMGVTVRLTEDQVRPLRTIDPLLFQGSHPESGVYMWYSTLSTPEVNGSRGASADVYYEAQINLSWIVTGPDDEVPPTQSARLAKLKTLAQPFEARLRQAIDDIPDGTEVLEIQLQDWPPISWDNRASTVTLAGDAAHAMTMYRGEAFNHGVTDAARLVENLGSAWNAGREGLAAAVDAYEADLMARTRPAVLLSRQACLDAHDLKNLKPDSPLVSKRARAVEDV